MALNTSKASAATNAAANAITALLNGGTVNGYTGAQPAAGGAITSQVLLFTLTYGNPAFGAAVSGTATANAITGANAVAGGTCTWARNLKSDGTTIVFDGSVGTSGCNVNMNSVVISSGAAVSLSSVTYQDVATASGL